MWKRIQVKVDYNTPFVLTFTLVCLVSLFVDFFSGGRLVGLLFSVPGHFNWVNPVHYLRLLLYPFGHANAEHFVVNFLLILLVGPILEEKYGWFRLLAISAGTAVITGLVHAALFSSGLIGASGIAFMMITLSSITRVRRGTIPLTFILVVLLFLGREVIGMVRVDDQVSQLTHILGGVCGAACGFWMVGRR